MLFQSFYQSTHLRRFSLWVISSLSGISAIASILSISIISATSVIAIILAISVISIIPVIDDRIRPIDDGAADHCDDQTELGNKSPQIEPINPGQPSLEGTDPTNDEDGHPLVRIRNDDQEQDD